MNADQTEPKAELHPREPDTEPAPLDQESAELPNILRSVLSPMEAETRRLGRKPNVEHLEPGTFSDPEHGVLPLFKPGDRIVVERYASQLKGNPWLDTRVFRVTRVFFGTEGDNSERKAWCLDDELDNFACIGYASPHQRVFLAPGSGDPFRAPRIHPAKEAVATAQEPGKKKRGRPKGSKNRPKAVRLEEKKQRAQIKRARLEKKRAAKRGTPQR